MSILVALLDGRKSITLSQRTKDAGYLGAVAATLCCGRLHTRSFPNPRSRSARARRGVQTLAGCSGT